jgi:hypothetical protein
MRTVSRFLSPVLIGSLIALSAATASAVPRGGKLFSTKKYDMKNGSSSTRISRAAHGGAARFMNNVGVASLIGLKGAEGKEPVVRSRNLKATLVGTTGTAIKGMLEYTYRVETRRKAADGAPLASTHITVADYDAVGPSGGRMRQAAFIVRPRNADVTLHPSIAPQKRRGGGPREP